MNITHQLKIERLERHSELDGKENVVFAAHWRLLSTNGKTTVSVAGIQKIKTDNLSSFIPYENLTEELVSSWVQDAMEKTNLNISKIYSTLDAEIEEIEKPKETLQPVPWTLN